jgi:chromosome segregation ATPase
VRGGGREGEGESGRELEERNNQVIQEMEQKIATAKKDLEKMSSERKEWEGTVATLKEKIQAGKEKADAPIAGNSKEKEEMEYKIKALEGEVTKLKKDLADEVEEKNLFEDVNKGTY